MVAQRQSEDEPEVLLGPVDLARRERMAIAMAWLSTGVFGLAAISQATAHNPWAATLDVFCALVCVAGTWLARRTGRVVLLTHVVLALVFAAVVTLSILVRGAGLSGATVMLAVLPLAATMILGARGGAVWLALSLIAGVVEGALGSAGII